jgi:hypothetical protein
MSAMTNFLTEKRRSPILGAMISKLNATFIFVKIGVSLGHRTIIHQHVTLG